MYLNKHWNLKLNTALFSWSLTIVSSSPTSTTCKASQVFYAGRWQSCLFWMLFGSASMAQGYKTSFMLNSAENKICSAYKQINTNNLNLFSCKTELSMNFFLLINIKMPTIVGILIFINRQKLCLTELSMKKVLYPWAQIDFLEMSNLERW